MAEFLPLKVYPFTLTLKLPIRTAVDGVFKYFFRAFQSVGWLVVFGFNSPLRQYFSPVLFKENQT